MITSSSTVFGSQVWLLPRDMCSSSAGDSVVLLLFGESTAVVIGVVVVVAVVAVVVGAGVVAFSLPLSLSCSVVVVVFKGSCVGSVCMRSCGVDWL